MPEAAERHVRLSNGAWSNRLTHYMVQPAECLTMRRFKGVVFAGPARTGKSQGLGDNWVAHNVMCDPADMLLVFPTDKIAQKFSKLRLDKLHRHSPDVRAKLGTSSSDDNIGEKHYKSGIRVMLVSPTKNTLATLDISKVLLSDYDRYDDDIGGDGSAWTLGSKRTQTFLSRGMTCAESSPSKPIIDPTWTVSPERPHEAPPTGGILGLYNDGDRRRLYAQCQHCGEYWMPVADVSGMVIPPAEGSSSRKSRSEAAGLLCTRCGAVNGQEHELNIKRSAVWLIEGESIDCNGVITGEPRESNIASFWMPGWFAAFQKWKDIAYAYLTALETYERTGDENALKGTTNVDQGAPYLEKGRTQERSAAELEQRANPDQARSIVPDGCRYLVMAVDVQVNRFVVQTIGFGLDGQRWVIDRFDLAMSRRQDGDGRAVALDPASHAEDWEVLDTEVLDKRYELDDGTGRTMAPIMVTCDMQGAPGVTERAYGYWRRLRRLGRSKRFRLVRGGNTIGAPRVRESFPDQNGPGGHKVAKQRGDVPVLQLNTDRLKDMVYAAIDRPEVGPGYVHFGSWLDASWYEELLAETRDVKGRYTQNTKRNESLDLFVYAVAGMIYAKGEKIIAENPPAWARSWDRNTQIDKQKPKAPPAKSAAEWVEKPKRTKRSNWINKR